MADAPFHAASEADITEFRPTQLIQQYIDLSAATVEHLQEFWPAQVELRAGTVSIYDYFPYLFAEAFPSLEVARLQPFAVAARLFASSIFLYDKIYDDVKDRAPTAHLIQANALRILAMQLESYRLLHHLFPPSAAFWNHFHNYLTDFAHAHIQEQRFVIASRPWQEYTEAVAFDIARGKNGIARATIAGLSDLAQDDHLLKPLTEAINQHNIAHQLWDDLSDWREDLETGVPSLLLARILPERPAVGNPEALKQLVHQLGHEIYYGGHAHFILELALESLDHADNLTGTIPNLAWRKVNGELRHLLQPLLKDIDRLVAQNLRRVSSQPAFTLALPPARNPWQKVAWHGLDFIIHQWRLGFGEARHIMEFPRDQGFSSDQEYQYGDVFQRAIIAEIMCDANEYLNSQLQPLINHEVDYLLSQRLADMGGWSYFPKLRELPPDADDLAQIMQILLRLDRRSDVRDYCERSLSTLLIDNSHADGSFETWIIPAVGRTPNQERHAEFARLAWGMGADNAVMANLLYALTRYDSARFAETIRRGLHYLSTRQQTDGSWTSTWYHGPYYGAYICLRLFAILSPKSEVIQRTLDFLRRQQKATGGGWGREDANDPLSTALSLLALAVAHSCSNDQEGDCERARRALAYLQQSQEAEQGWPNCEFVRMELGRATGKEGPILSYGSRTITTAFVLKAALAWHRLV